MQLCTYLSFARVLYTSADIYSAILHKKKYIYLNTFYIYDGGILFPTNNDVI